MIAGMLGVMIVVLGGIITYPVWHPSEHALIEKHHRTKTAAATVDYMMERFIYSKDETTGICYVTYSRSIDTLASVPCNEKVLEVIRKQRADNVRVLYNE